MYTHFIFHFAGRVYHELCRTDSIEQFRQAYFQMVKWKYENISWVKSDLDIPLDALVITD